MILYIGILPTIDHFDAEIEKINAAFLAQDGQLLIHDGRFEVGTALGNSTELKMIGFHSSTKNWYQGTSFLEMLV